MTDIDWCKQQKKGIRIIEPNKHIADEYIKKSDVSLTVMTSSPNEEWKIICAYYACYDAIYALLRKAGIKCEIHECSIALMEFFGFSDNDISFMSDLKKKRIDAQYYVNKNVHLKDMNEIKDFVLKCKQIIHSANFEEIRQKITNALK